METVAVIGASPNQDRYANKAIRLLADHDHTPSLADISEKIDTVTMYLGPARQEEIIKQIIQAAPRRVIFNPDTENPGAYARLKTAGIEVIEACTLVLLKTNQY